MTPEEEAIHKMANSSKQVLLAMGVLLGALISTSKAINRLVEAHEHKTISENPARSRKEACDRMVQEYSSNVN